ncbi:MAG: cytidine deaminase [Bacilli bacterium]|nr:cytidine deaminase [Bacilli bacterium]
MEDKFVLVKKAYDNAYAKYSNFKVGAVVLLKNGEYFLGSNIENASYGLTNCAERSALFAAYSNGYRKEDILELVVIASTEYPVSPCGACRQVISELMEQEAIVTMTNLKGLVKTVKVKELIPFCFDEGDLNDK